MHVDKLVMMMQDESGMGEYKITEAEAAVHSEQYE